MKKYIIDTNYFSPGYMKNDNCYVSQAQVDFEEFKPEVVELIEGQSIIKIDEDIYKEAERIINKYEDPKDDIFSLSKNEGSADPFIIASAIARQKQNPGDEWIVVTNEKSIKEICKAEGIMVLSGEEFNGSYENTN